MMIELAGGVQPVAAVGPHRDRNTHQSVEERERRTGQQAPLGIIQAERVDNRLGDNGNECSVDEVQRVDQHQGDQDIGPVTLCTKPGYLSVRRGCVAHALSASL